MKHSSGVPLSHILVGERLDKCDVSMIVLHFVVISLIFFQASKNTIFTGVTTSTDKREPCSLFRSRMSIYEKHRNKIKNLH